ncbi:MAG: type II toxin-antitoxin system VapC family toxin [Gemmatimonadota bacterium]
MTAVDSSVLLDVLVPDPDFGRASLRALEAARARGQLVVSAVAWSEVRAYFEDDAAMDAALAEAGLAFDPFDQEMANLAGAAWADFRRRGGRRARLLPDFLIAAHAVRRGGRLLTRDRGFNRLFPDLEVIEPG